VIASEDAAFVSHTGVDWASLEKAWDRNQRAEARAEARAQQQPPGGRRVEPKVVGGSTITQQLAKNLFLSGERTLPRKAQELALTLMLETLLSKQRILEITPTPSNGVRACLARRPPRSTITANPLRV